MAYVKELFAALSIHETIEKYAFLKRFSSKLKVCEALSHKDTVL